MVRRSDDALPGGVQKRCFFVSVSVFFSFRYFLLVFGFLPRFRFFLSCFCFCLLFAFLHLFSNAFVGLSLMKVFAVRLT